MSRISGIIKYTCLFLGIAMLSISYFFEELLLEMVVISFIAIMSIRLFIKKDPHLSLRDVSVPILALLYVPVFLTFQIQIRKFGPEWIIFLYALVWGSDSMAYYVGKGFGKRRLYATVSPNKTIAGAVGSIFGGVLCSLFLSATFITILTASSSLVIGIMIGCTSIIGDLVESMFKRDAGIKDSGAAIPGHGGILDKIDGVLLGGPVLYYILLYMGIA
jgi:phosphatidate cytidylyltransferase